MRFIHAEYFWYLLLVPPAAWALWKIVQRARYTLRVWIGEDNVLKHYPLSRNSLRLAALVFAVLALLGPSIGRSTAGSQVLGRQVYFLLDVSASMNVEDVGGSRLALAKREIRKVAEQLRGEQLGLIVFTNYGYVQCPLTRDIGALQMYLNLVETQQFGNTGTDLRAALQTTFVRFMAEQSKDSLGQDRLDERMARAIVLLTDGGHHGQKYQSVLNELNEYGINLFLVGVGTPSGGAVPDFDADGNKVGFKKDKNQLARAILERDSLLALAEDNARGYYELNGSGDNLNLLAADLKTMPAGIVATKAALAPSDRYRWFLLPALLCLLVSLFLLPERKPTPAAS